MEPERPPEPALSTARLVAEELVERGASAVVLAGRGARGAGPESDPDIVKVGPEESSWRLERRDGFLVSVSTRPFERHREAFALPQKVCSPVPGWREALVVYDPDGLAASLIEEVRAWTRGPLERRCDK